MGRYEIPQNTPQTILEFDTPEGIASPVFRQDPGFVSPGTGQTEAYPLRQPPGRQTAKGHLV